MESEDGNEFIEIAQQLRASTDMGSASQKGRVNASSLTNYGRGLNLNDNA